MCTYGLPIWPIIWDAYMYMYIYIYIHVSYTCMHHVAPLKRGLDL